MSLKKTPDLTSSRERAGISDSRRARRRNRPAYVWRAEPTMKTARSVWLMLICSVLATFSSYRLQAAAARLNYRGFTIDESRLTNSDNIEELRGALREQIDIVCAVGLPDDV